MTGSLDNILDRMYEIDPGIYAPRKGSNLDILSGLQVPACLINGTGEILIVNSLFAGISPGRQMVRNICTHFRSDVYPDRNFPLEKFSKEQLGIELLIHDVEYTAQLHAYNAQDASGYLVTFRRKLPTRTISPALQAQMLRYSVDCIKLVKSDGTLEYMNRAGCIALGINETEETFGMQWLDLLPADVRRSGQSKLEAALDGASGSFPGRSVNESGEVTYWDNLLMPVNDPKSGERKVICVSRNVTEEILAKAKLKHLSETDELTGLCNRRHFNDVLTAYFAGECAPSHLFLVDLDRFKSINDTHGHHAGDYLLQTLAERWRQSIAGDTVVARLGGDEFAILCSDPGDNFSCLDEVIATISGASKTPVEIDGYRLDFGISIGCVALPSHAESAHEALVHADKALRQAKHAGRGTCCVYQPPLVTGP